MSSQQLFFETAHVLSHTGLGEAVPATLLFLL